MQLLSFIGRHGCQLNGYPTDAWHSRSCCLGLVTDLVFQRAASNGESQQDLYLTVGDLDITDHAQFDNTLAQFRVHDLSQRLFDLFNRCHKLCSFRW